MFNKEAFLNNLLLLVQDEKVRASMSQEGWNFVKDKFHYTRLIRDFNTLYGNLLR
jgi:hypothetical protein